eukprot:03106.XXX_67906_68034_1 [CDS] Oithona nana genome sequencing.
MVFLTATRTISITARHDEFMINDVRVRHERRRPTVYGDDLGQ